MPGQPILRQLQIILLLFCLTSVTLAQDSPPTPQWIWTPVHLTGEVPVSPCFFRKTFDVASASTGHVSVAADDRFEVFVNGRRVGMGEEWRYMTRIDISRHLSIGQNVVAIKVVNKQVGDAGLAAKIELQSATEQYTHVSDSTWRTSTVAIGNWHSVRYAATSWKTAQALGPWGNTSPWIAQRWPSRRRVSHQTASDSRPPRVEQPEQPDDSHVVLAAAHEAAPKRNPGLLQAFSKGPLAKLKTLGRHRANVPAHANHTQQPHAAQQPLPQLQPAPRQLPTIVSPGNNNNHKVQPQVLHPSRLATEQPNVSDPQPAPHTHQSPAKRGFRALGGLGPKIIANPFAKRNRKPKNHQHQAAAPTNTGQPTLATPLAQQPVPQPQPTAAAAAPSATTPTHRPRPVKLPVQPPTATRVKTLPPRITDPSSLPSPQATVQAGAKRKAATTDVDARPVAPTHVQRNEFKPQKGFRVENVLKHAQTGSLISTSFNEFGQILAGRENGPLLLASDSDKDGEFETVRTYCDKVKNCQGILALSGMIFVLAEGPEGHGLYRLQDEDRDGTLEKVAALATFEVDSLEHGPHGMVLGPDGNLYVSVGNHAKLKGKFSKLSPRRHLYEGDLVPRYEDPGGHADGVRLPGGYVLRIDVAGRRAELFASGLRNTYDLAFNSAGHLFTYDSDMESDMGSTWYRPTRLYHVPAGGEFGWRSGWAKWPEYYHDVVPPLADTGRGSPTGMVVYQHDAYPEKYHNSLFVADWSEGRILSTTLAADGAGYAAEPETFLTGKPLNVTDIEVGPDGLLYFATGGRGSQGGLYRVAWDGGEAAKASEKRSKLVGIDKALTAPQIQSSWGRQAVAAVQMQLGPSWNKEVVRAAKDTKRPAAQRRQALQLMQWLGPIPTPELLLEMSRDDDATIRQAAAYFMSSSQDDRVPTRLLEMFNDTDARVRRQACESLVRANRSVPFEYLESLLQSTDRYENWAARRLLALDHPKEWADAALTSEHVRVFTQAATTLMTAWPSKKYAMQVAERTQAFLAGYVTDADFLDLIRLLQLAVLRGEILSHEIPELTAALAEEFPASHDLMNRELVRLLVRLQVSSIADRYLAHLDSDIPQPERLHLAAHLRFLKADWTTEQRLAILEHLNPTKAQGNSLPGYMQNIAADFGQGLDSNEDAVIITKGAQFPSAALAAVMRLPKELSETQIQDLVQLDESVTSGDEISKRLKVAILAVLARDGKPAGMAHLRNVYDQSPKRRPEAAIGMAEQPDGKNWIYLVRSLTLLDNDVAREIVRKLQSVDRSPTSAEPYRQAIITGLKLGKNGGDEAVRLMEHWRGFASSAETPAWDVALKAWQTWFKKTYPNADPPVLKATPEVADRWDYDRLLVHLQKGGLDQASAERGKVVFVEAQCAKCHRHGELGEAMGPDLTAIGRRFLPREIVDAIVYPSRVISDQYRSQNVITHAGQVYTGLVGAGGQDAKVVLQTDGRKVTVADSEIMSTTPSKISAMPEGLLNGLTLDQIMDLMAFLNQTAAADVARQPGDDSVR